MHRQTAYLHRIAVGVLSQRLNGVVMLKIFEGIFWVAVVLFGAMIAYLVLGKAFPVLLAYGTATLAHEAAMDMLPRHGIIRSERAVKAASFVIAAAFFIPIAYYGWQMVPNLSNRMDSPSCYGRGCD